MNATLLSFALALSLAGQQGPTPARELDYQKAAFRQWWEQDLVLKLSDLPDEGMVAGFRIPYAGHDYPDKLGGTIDAMIKYDRAFHGGRPLAAEYERRDVGAHRRGRYGEEPVRRGLFARFRGPRTPSWYGHCNGWTAAAIRHAEPQRSVTRNGVVFTPADIKGLLAEIYMYTETEFLGGEDAVIHPAIFHITLANWLGRGEHPIGMETAVGEVVINYPIYSYKSVINRLSDRQAEVKTSIRYRMNIGREMDKGPDQSQVMYFHYVLDLDSKGEIVGGRYYGDSARIDMLWAPLKPVQGGKKGNERGNPHLDVKEVLAIWRESVPQELRNKWFNIDPTDEDRILSDEEKARLAAEKAEAEKPASQPAEGSATSGTPSNASAAGDVAAAAPRSGGPRAAADDSTAATDERRMP
jgi:hypothetical protein